MRAEYINPFLHSTKEMLMQMAQINIELTGTTVKRSPLFAKKVVIVVGITGALRGSVAIGIDYDFARHIASNMMMGMEVSELDEMSKSALKELSNILMGQVATQFESKGVNIDITPPTLMTGDNINISVDVMPLLSMKFKNEARDDMEMEFDISLKEVA